MKISEVMTRDVKTVRPDQTAKEAATFMLDEDAGSMPVSDGDKLVGMLTDRDIAVRGVAQGYGPDTPISQIMSENVVSAHEDDDVQDIATKMSRAQVRRIPVLDSNDRICGIVSLGDLSREADEDCAEQALQGVSAPGDKHRQG
jgi:CBS domain-containing protein